MMWPVRALDSRLGDLMAGRTEERPLGWICRTPKTSSEIPVNHLERGTQYKSGLPEIDLDIKTNVTLFCITSSWDLGAYLLHFVHLDSRKAQSWKYCLIIIIISSGIPKIIRSYLEGKSKYIFSPLKWFMISLLICIIIKTFVYDLHISWDLYMPRHVQWTRGQPARSLLRWVTRLAT